ncbi:PaaI family thioesterase [Neobittarella massiliensis]|uniref:Acyl-coenzyme A thioesterase THEM4 n=2 Tax=Oscillospiraceae TaxID=216572 RepID=A0A8J6IR62_9FIRM|nr:PaaI family thioesterase [Neobittarella massiliensis]MBC3517131.1 PaaI family thioesterase [Neobittarella massiliensis]SCJ73015.1 Uncharacterized protein%2C possibly involved in aromatic compounds catabolism [uncultured Anaerotruncus sp.]
MRVREKQANSRMCVICGMDNPLGVQAPFYVMEDDSVMTRFCYRPEHQSYPGRVHGGMITAMLDELGFRAYWVVEPEVLAVTMTLQTKYRKPVPYGVPLLGQGSIEMANSRFVKSHAEIRDLDGEVLAEAEMKYIKLPSAAVTDADFHEEMCYPLIDDVWEL